MSERTHQIGELAFRRYAEVWRALGRIRQLWEELHADEREAWAEATLVAFNMGVMAMGGDPSNPVHVLNVDETGLGWRRRAHAADGREATLREAVERIREERDDARRERERLRNEVDCMRRLVEAAVHWSGVRSQVLQEYTVLITPLDRTLDNAVRAYKKAGERMEKGSRRGVAGDYCEVGNNCGRAGCPECQA
jgi:hypothetical protein